MKKQETNRWKHLSCQDRQLIEIRLNENCSFRTIAKELNCSSSTIMREVKNHASATKAKINDCVHHRDCFKNDSCNSTTCHHQCHNCIRCRDYCTDYNRETCSKLSKSPYLCNGCHKIVYCKYYKNVYYANKANKAYRDTLIGARNGFRLNLDEIEQIDTLVSPLILKGQSPYHIKQTLGSRLLISESTIRRLIDCCELNARNIDLRDQVKRKPRKSAYRKIHDEVISKLKEGRLYNDYLDYSNENEIIAAQMDCVEGKRDENCFPWFSV